MPYRVAGVNVASPRTILPTFHGVQAVDVLLGRHGALHLELSPVGSGELHEDAVDVGVAWFSRRRRQRLALGHVRADRPARSRMPSVMPLCFAPT